MQVIWILDSCDAKLSNVQERGPILQGTSIRLITEPSQFVTTHMSVKAHLVTDTTSRLVGLGYESGVLYLNS